MRFMCVIVRVRFRCCLLMNSFVGVVRNWWCVCLLFIVKFCLFVSRWFWLKFSGVFWKFSWCLISVFLRKVRVFVLICWRFVFG